MPGYYAPMGDIVRAELCDCGCNQIKLVISRADCEQPLGFVSLDAGAAQSIGEALIRYAEKAANKQAAAPRTASEAVN